MANPGWEFSLDEWRVSVNGPLAADLRRVAIEGFVALPRRGMEVGGVLYGETRDGEIRIQSFEETLCEHRYGPSYALSDTDRVQLAELLETRRSGSVPVIGIFRSFTGREPEVDEADAVSVAEHFPTGVFLFLALQPVSPEKCTASLRLFQDGKLLPGIAEATLATDTPAPVPAALKEPKLEPRIDPRFDMEPETEPAPPSLPPPRISARDREPTEQPRSKHIQLRMAILIVLITVACELGAYEIWKLAREPRWTDLHLNARPAGGQLELTWNGSAAAAVHATRGLLAIAAGEMRREIELQPGEVRAGKYTIPASNNDVAVRLTLYSNNLGVAGDTLRVTTISSAASPPVPKPVAPPRNPIQGEADRVTPERPAPPVEVSLPAPAVPPSIVHEVQAEIPEGIRSRLTERIVIPVRVDVSDRGRVLHARVLVPDGDSVQRYLAEQAQRAALQWRFTPARSRRGTRIAASRTIDFVFAP